MSADELSYGPLMPPANDRCADHHGVIRIERHVARQLVNVVKRDDRTAFFDLIAMRVAIFLVCP